jgi:hypothetical protein
MRWREYEAGRALPTFVTARLLLWEAVACNAVNGGGGIACSAKLTFAHHMPSDETRNCSVSTMKAKQKDIAAAQTEIIRILKLQRMASTGHPFYFEFILNFQDVLG